MGNLPGTLVGVVAPKIGIVGVETVGRANGGVCPGDVGPRVGLLIAGPTFVVGGLVEGIAIVGDCGRRFADDGLENGGMLGRVETGEEVGDGIWTGAMLGGVVVGSFAGATVGGIVGGSVGCSTGLFEGFSPCGVGRSVSL